MIKNRKSSLSEEIVISIRNRIYNGELLPGTHLVEQDIATQFGVSRGPVREALKELEYAGLIISEANKGSTIAYLTGEDAFEVFYLRGSLEKMALEKCGGKLLDSSIMVMRNLVEDMKYEEERANRMHLKIIYDEMFHEEILKSSKMPRLYNLWKNLSPLNGSMFLKLEACYRHMEEEAVRNNKPRPSKTRKKTWEAHRDMLEVFEQGKLQEAISITEAHYYNTGAMILQWEKRKENKIE